MSRKFTDRHLVGRFLQLQNLLIHELTLFVMNNVWVKRTLVARLITRLFATTATPRKGQSREASFNVDIFAMIAVLAADVNESGL